MSWKTNKQQQTTTTTATTKLFEIFVPLLDFMFSHFFLFHCLNSCRVQTQWLLR